MKSLDKKRIQIRFGLWICSWIRSGLNSARARDEGEESVVFVLKRIKLLTRISKRGCDANWITRCSPRM